MTKALCECRGIYTGICCLCYCFGFSLPKSLHTQRSLQRFLLPVASLPTVFLSEMKLGIPPLCEGEKQPARELKGLGWGLQQAFSTGL